MTETSAKKSPSPVYFWNLRASGKAPYDVRIRKLLKQTGIAAHLSKDDLVAMKIHFGEQGSTGFISPHLVKPFVDFFQKSGTNPFLTDTNTLYTGQRGEAVSHALLAAKHGFDPNILGAPVIIADGLKSDNQVPVSYPGKHFERFYLAGDIVNAEQIVNISHFKGHMLTGFGGAIKNLGMGCATRSGKMQQHCDLAPVLNRKLCRGCAECTLVCRPGALQLDAEGIVSIKEEYCTGCASCVHTCSTGAININWQVDMKRFLERMLEYTAALIKTRNRPILHINSLTGISPGCDCNNHNDAPICPDIGILASFDPLALDRASLDMVNAATPLINGQLPQNTQKGEDKFLALHPHAHLDHFFDYAKELELGEENYHLVSI